MGDAVQRPAGRAQDVAPPGGERPSEHRAAEVDHQVPVGGNGLAPKAEPVPRPALLLHRDDPVQAGCRPEQRRRVRAAGDGDSGGWVARDQVRQQAGAQHGIADPIGGYEQDLHRRRGLAGWRVAALYGAGGRYATRAATGNRLPTGGAAPN